MCLRFKDTGNTDSNALNISIFNKHTGNFFENSTTKDRLESYFQENFSCTSTPTKNLSYIYLLSLTNLDISHVIPSI